MRDHQYFVYMMSSSSGTLYIGMADSIYRGALQHKKGEIEGFTKKYHCTGLVHYEGFDDVHRSIGREKELKGWTRVERLPWSNQEILDGPTWPNTGDHKCSSPGNR